MIVGEKIGTYEIDEIIDEGGMAVVYLGIHKTLKRKVAFKMLDPVLAKNPQYIERFRNEALLLSKLNHPNIIQIYDYIENKKGVFIVSEYVKGQTLEEYIDLVTGPMPETRAVKLMLKILESIRHLHSKDIIHRDLKPSNFIITEDDDVKLIDFGIAKSLEKNSPLLTKDGAKVGTTIFMSPQQVKGQVIDRRSDVYSLGATFFYMVTGQYPYDKSLSEYEIYTRIVNEAFPNPKNFYVGVSDKIRDIILKATEKKPLSRFQSCEEFIYALLQSSGKKEIKNVSISLKTKIVEASDFDLKNKVFTNRFWQNLVMFLSTLFFLTALGVGMYFLTNNDNRHIIEGEEYLLESDSIGSKVIEKLNYGETVNVLSKPKKTKGNKTFIKVSSLRNNSGYLPLESITDLHTYKQINSIFNNNYSRLYIPAKFKIALRNYLAENLLIRENYSKWKMYANPYKQFDFNYFSNGDYNNNGIQDLAFIIVHETTQNSKLLIFFDDGTTLAEAKFNGPVKIKNISKGKPGGKWFLGNNLGGNSPVYEHLGSDAVLILKPETAENILYLYLPQEKRLIFYNQSK